MGSSREKQQHNTMARVSYFFLLLAIHSITLRGEDEVMEDEEVIGEKGGTKEIDWSEMLQMGLALGKSILGEEAVEKLKKGDLSELIKVGEKVLGEDTVKDFLNSATEGAFDTTEDAKEEKNNSDDNDILEDDLEEATEDSPDPVSEEGTESVPTDKVADEL